jgi:hypothetical protein
MIESNIQSIEELLLHDEDFPLNYVDMTHPDDYKVKRKIFIVKQEFLD